MLKKFLITFICLIVPFVLKGDDPASTNDTVSFSLEKAVEWSLNHNEAILAAGDVIKEAEAGVTIARAGFLPEVTAQCSYARLSQVPAFEMPGPGFMPVYGDYMGNPDTSNILGWTIAPFGADPENPIEYSMGEKDNYSAGVSLTQPLFTFGKIFDGYQIARINLEVAGEDFRKQRNELVFNVTQSFYGILVLKEFVKVTEVSYEQTRRHIDVVKKRFDAGLSSDFELLRANVQLKNMEPQLLKVRNNLKMAEKNFKTLLGLSQRDLIKLEGDLKYEKIEIDLDGLIEKAKEERPEARSISLKRQMAEKALSITKKANLPNVAFVANYEYKKPIYFDNEWGSDWNVAVAVQMPLFTGFENLGKKREAQNRLSQATHYVKMLDDMIELEIRSICLKLEEAEKLVESQKENVVQSEKALEIVERRYELGLATSLEVMDTQIALTRAKTNQLQALSDYLIARANLEKAIGGKEDR